MSVDRLLLTIGGVAERDAIGGMRAISGCLSGKQLLGDGVRLSTAMDGLFSLREDDEASLRRGLAYARAALCGGNVR